eukprot:1517568-Amphidinium_carterae.1
MQFRRLSIGHRPSHHHGRQEQESKTFHYTAVDAQETPNHPQKDYALEGEDAALEAINAKLTT